MRPQAPNRPIHPPLPPCPIHLTASRAAVVLPVCTLLSSSCRTQTLVKFGDSLGKPHPPPCTPQALLFVGRAMVGMAEAYLLAIYLVANELVSK